MRRTLTGFAPRAFGRTWLALLVHMDAARQHPRAYLAAFWWRVRGKRLRARARFAPLLSASPRAYRLWLHDEIGDTDRAEDAAEATSIIALVEGEHDGTGLQQTLRSLAGEGIPALVIGSPDVPDPASAVSRIDWSLDPWLMPLRAGDTLASGAARSYRRAATASDAPVLYADDDLLERGTRGVPHFKPGWNPELFRHLDYLTGACMLRAPRALVEGLRGKDWAARLVAAAVRRGTPAHVPQVLHHRRSRPAPRLPAALVIEDAVLPPVTVIVPTRNRVELLRTCIAGLERTRYPAMEVIVVDNDSDDAATLAYLDTLAANGHRVLSHRGPFNFSAINNSAADQASGSLLCLLNNDVEVLAPDWLSIMAAQAQRPEVGAVGARLLYPDGRIQHAGVVLGIGGGAAHAHRLLHPDAEGYFRRHALPQFVSAVTAACMVVRRDAFLAVGGFDESNYAVAFNDVDLCMRLNRRGWQSLYEPRATLVHHESLSRGLDRDPVGAARLAGELAALDAAWGTRTGVDPFHHPRLDRYSEQFAVGLRQHRG